MEKLIVAIAVAILTGIAANYHEPLAFGMIAYLLSVIILKDESKE